MTRIRRNLIRALLSGDKSYWELIRFQDDSLPKFEEELSNLLNEGLRILVIYNRGNNNESCCTL